MSPSMEPRRSLPPEPALTPARIERQWSAVRARSAPSSVGGWVRGGLVVMGLAVVALATLFVWRGAEDASGVLAAGGAVETAEAPMRVALVEGSEIEVGSESRLSVRDARGLEDVDVELARGRARFDVVRRPSRAFRVHAVSDGGVEVEVTVIGTAFTVAHEGGEIGVRVERGVVEVRVGGDVTRLTVGQEWRSRPADEGTADEAAAPSQDTEPSTPVGTPTETEPHAGLEAHASTTVNEAEVAHPRRTPAVPAPDARVLFERAREARQAGSVAEAARLYGELVAAHDDDPRAGVAAFELARLRMDHLGDPRGALRAVDRALAGGSGAYREDAMARRAVLLDRLGREVECRSAREAYLGSFAAGVHRAEISALCP